MITDGKRITDMALGVAEMGACAFGQVGMGVAAGIGLFEMLFDIFCPGPDVDPAQLPATKANLEAAVDELKKAIINDSPWATAIQDMRDDVVTENGKFLRFWGVMGAMKFQTVTIPGAPPDESYLVPDTGTQFDNDDLATYFNLGGPNLADTLEKHMQTLSHGGQLQRNQASGLYGLMASLTISYYKAAVIWRWATRVVQWNQCRHYRAMKKRDPQSDIRWPLRDGVAEPTSEPDWNEFTGTDSVVKTMLAKIDEIVTFAEGTDAAPGLYTAMRTNWDKRRQTIADRTAQFTIATDGSSFWYLDGETGQISWKTAHRDLAQLYLDSKCGALTAFLWTYWGRQYGLDGVDEDNIERLGDSLRLWKMARGSVQFTAISAPAADTLENIAKNALHQKPHPKFGKKIYPNWDDRYLWAIYFANTSLLKWALPANPNLKAVKVAAGQTLKMPDPATFTTYEVKAGDTIRALAVRFYGSERYEPMLRLVNTLADPVAGQVLLMPDLFTSTYIVDTAETLQSIAADRYGAEEFDKAIFDANRESLKLKPATGKEPEWERVTLEKGQELKLIDSRAIDFIVYKTEPGETVVDLEKHLGIDLSTAPKPVTITEKVLAGFAALLVVRLAGTIAEINAGVDLTNLRAGTLVRLPILGLYNNVSSSS